MKLRLCYEIVKNLGRLLSFDFWKVVIREPRVGVYFIKAILFTAVIDIVSMIIIPGYPEDNASD
jgi:hypothetical protein